jgi:hypothetical protein
MDISSLLRDPSWFLASIDPEAQNLAFVETNLTNLHSAPFLDGRVSISARDKIVHVPIKKALKADIDQTHPDRLLTHMSFCGSTYVSRTLEGAGEALSYREPHALVELATLKALGHSITKDYSFWIDLLRLTLSQYRKPWPNVVPLVKPSNWANSLLSDLLEASPDAKIVSLEFGAKDYLVANLRGGRSRLQYSLNLLNHFLSANSAFRGTVLDVERANLDPMQRLLRLLVIVFETQKQILDRTIGKSNGHRFKWANVSKDPQTHLPKIAQALDFNLSQDSISTALAKEYGHHAKDKSETYTADEEARRNKEISDQFAEDLNLALDWRSSKLGLAA